MLINFVSWYNVPFLLLNSWELQAKLFDGEAAAGPVPALFSEDAASSTEALRSNPKKAHQDLQRAAKIFMMPETVELTEALAIMKRPR
jgi:hypothetical protein